MLERFHDLGIRNKLIVILSGAVIALTTAVLVAVWVGALREVRDDVDKELEDARSSFEKIQGAHLHEHALEAAEMAMSPELVELLKTHDTERTCAFLRRFVGTQPHSDDHEVGFDYAALVYTDGHPLSVLVRGIGGCNGARAKRLDVLVVKTQNRPAITNWESSQDKLYEIVSAPVSENNGRVIGRLALGFEVSDALAIDSKEHTGSETVFWHMEDHHAHVLGATIPELRDEMVRTLEAQSADAHEFTLNAKGNSYSVLEADIEDSQDEVNNPEQLHMALVQSVTERMKPFRGIEFNLGALAACALVLGLLLGVVVSRPIAAPLMSLAKAAEGVQGGRFDAVDELTSRYPLRIKARDEVGVLSRAFIDMVRGLKERLLMATFVSQTTYERIRQSNGHDMSSERTTLAILFSDIRGFTSYSESRDPGAVIELLNRVLSIQADIIHKHGGDIDKYVGDEVVATFSEDRRCERAVLAAKEIVDTLEREFGGQPGTRVGIGINSGEVVVGCVGSRERRDHTAIGSPMNMTARLCANAEAGQVLISESVKAALPASIKIRNLSALNLKGFSEVVPVYEVVSSAAKM